MPRFNELEGKTFRLPSALKALRTEKRSAMIGFTLPQETADQIEAISRAQGRTKSEWCAQVVSAALDDQAKRFR